MRIGLEILGAIWLLQTSYKVLIKNHKEKRRGKETKELADKYFKEN